MNAPDGSGSDAHPGPARRLGARAARRAAPVLERWRYGRDRGGEPTSTASVAEWVRASGRGEVRDLEPGYGIPKRPPSTLDADVDVRFTRNPTIPVGPRYLARVPRARIDVPPGSPWPAYGPDPATRPRVVLPDGSIAVESVFGFAPTVAPSARRVRPQPGRWFSLLTPWGLQGNYYHWVHDVLIRLSAVVDLLPDDVRFVVPPEIRPYQVESLAMLGIERHRLVAFAAPPAPRRVRPWECEELFFCPLGQLDVAALIHFREAMLARPQPAAPGPRRVYISRSDASYRRVLNETEVMARLAPLGFERHVLSGLGFADQIALFRDAEVIIGPHGAGMTNAAFARPGATLIDLQSSEVDHYFHNLAQPLHLEYWYLVGETHSSGIDYRSDIVVPLDPLDELLARALPR